MYRIIDGRATGKTSRLMLLAKETGAVIACANPENMRRKAMNYGIIGLTFISYKDLLSCGRRFNKVLIDELETFVHYSIGVNGSVIGYSLSNEE